jgi:menaquinone-specific isochorismate synthase
MLVTRFCDQHFQNQRDLYQFLTQYQCHNNDENHPPIVSIAFAIDPIDPLIVFDRLAKSDQLNFYFEKQDFSKYPFLKSQRMAIAAIGSILKLQTESVHRFTQVKEFIQATLARTIVAGSPVAASSMGTAFFCSFAFQPAASTSYPALFPGATVFLPKWQVSNHNQTCSVVCNVLMDNTIEVATRVEEIWQTLQQIQSMRKEQVASFAVVETSLQMQDVASTEMFKQSVQAALTAIETHQFDKIVLAHAVDVVSPLPFDRGRCLNNLRRLYPDCYIFLITNENGHAFLGASPERLVSVQNRQLVTDALAGSAPRGPTKREDAYLATTLLNSHKDNYEHQLVVDFITRKLTQLGLKPELSPLKLLQLSNIQHLHTPIQAIVPATVHLLDILAELHPTPAVAGLPQDVACTEIDRWEPFERSLYAAPIGWINPQGDGEFAVGIRSALIDGCRARLFAGAGIVAGSDPDRELAEVQLKLQALLATLV